MNSINFVLENVFNKLDLVAVFRLVYNNPLRAVLNSLFL